MDATANTKLCFLNKKINDIDTRTTAEMLRMTELSSVALDFLGNSYYSTAEASAMFATKPELAALSGSNASVSTYTRAEADEAFASKAAVYSKSEADARYVSSDQAGDFLTTTASGIVAGADHVSFSKSIVPAGGAVVTLGSSTAPFQSAHCNALYVGDSSLVSSSSGDVLSVQPGKLMLGDTLIESLPGGDVRFTAGATVFTLSELASLLSSNQQRLDAL
jgi:hypothetical protein